MVVISTPIVLMVVGIPGYIYLVKLARDLTRVLGKAQEKGNGIPKFQGAHGR